MLLTDLLKFLKSRAFLFAVLVIAALMTLGGCSSLNMLGNKSADKIAPLIDKYCASFDENVRAELRAKINQRTNGNQVRIACARDAAPETQG